MPSPRDPVAEARAWAEIDHELVRLKIELTAKGFHEKHEQRPKGCVRGNAGIDLAALAHLYSEEANELAETYLGIYKEVWEIQGKPRTPEFLRAVLNRSLIPEAIQGRVGAAKSDIEYTARRTGQLNDIGPLLAELARAADRLQSEWRTRIEIKARKLELEQRKASATAARGRKETEMAPRISKAPEPAPELGRGSWIPVN